MKVRLSLLALLLAFVVVSASTRAQVVSPSSSSHTAATAGKAPPVITKIDPPNWWAAMPDPMLLVRGENLKAARFAVQGTGVTLKSTTVSDNGHWAFLWLTTAHASPQMLHIQAISPTGSATAAFALKQRKPPTTAFRGFSSSDVMYLIMTDRFADGDPSNNQPAGLTPEFDRSKPRGWHGGDLKGIQQHLDYLQQLGVTTLWTTPVYDNSGSPNSYHGYGATDVYAVDPHFGTLADYQNLVDALHKRGMKIVMDVVPNHVGPGHPWAADSPAPEWFHGTVDHHPKPNYDFKTIPDPHAPELLKRGVIEGWFADMLPDMDTENPLVSKYLIQNAVWWVETASLDGLRIDTFPYVNRAFWHDFHAQLHSLYPHLTTVGEVFNGDPTITSYFAGGIVRQGIDTGLDTPFDFPVHFLLRNTLIKGQPMTEFSNILRQDWMYPHPERLVTFLGNHDTTRFLSEPGSSPAKLKIAFGLLTTLRGMPQFYSGDEIAMTGGEDPDNRHDFPGGFPGDAHNAFTEEGRSTDQQAMFHWVSDLTHFRAAHPALQSGQQQYVLEDQTVMAFVRTADIQSGCSAKNSGEREIIVVNNSDKPRDIVIETRDTSLAGCLSVKGALNATSQPSIDGTRIKIQAGPNQFAIYTAR